MRNREIRKLLKTTYTAPVSVDKDAFLREHPRSEIGYRQLLAMQVRYMPPLAWLLSGVFFVLIRMLAAYLDPDSMWLASALTPFLALIVVCVNNQSDHYGMAEWELASRFSLQSILLARLLILGIFHLCLLAVLSPVLARSCSIGFIRTCVYLLVPYLTSCTAGMILGRTFHGDESLYASVLASAIVCLLFGLPGVFLPFTYREEQFGIWVVLLAALAIALTFEIHSFIGKIGGLYEASC